MSWKQRTNPAVSSQKSIGNSDIIGYKVSGVAEKDISAIKSFGSGYSLKCRYIALMRGKSWS